MKLVKNQVRVISLGVLLLMGVNSFLYASKKQNDVKKIDPKPHIVNIINFIRLCEPRVAEITEDVLFQTVVKQTEIMRKNNLKGTFLLQYDALMDSRYQKLFKNMPDSLFEVGAWWELPQPLIENSGLKWRGRYPWDWAANVGFSIGYTPQEREKIVDTYMADFKKIYGHYPKSVGSWFIDAHSLNYMYKKYGIVACCMCRDQIGTDGYTLWGGYWNQAYYPSVKNELMPAQNPENQIPVPVFRMLGSDPVRQYDDGLGSDWQGVSTLEPSYENGGGDATWVNWYFNEFTKRACMEYAYVQVGQENSFTWDRMSKGYEIQIPLVAKLRDENKIQIKTLAEAGKWFHNRYKTTPSTSVTVQEDLNGSDRKTVWFNSRFFRTNLLWEKGTLRFRDIHMFDEKLPSDYLTQKGLTSNCSFFTLPFVDGYVWSTPDTIAGLRFKFFVKDQEIQISGGNPIITDSIPGKLHIVWPLLPFSGNLVIDLTEREMQIKLEGKGPDKWYLDLTTANSAKLPFDKISSQRVDCTFKDLAYHVIAKKGYFDKPQENVVFRIKPHSNTIKLDFSER
ncbi:MAG: hypothetical protein Q8862_08905 [Bacteroidota bacterium]|nr:hypothetical protein [Bacteroidota bacterium]MDP4205076.1 hypothetical protein [Bacteroidota bacterium]